MTRLRLLLVLSWLWSSLCSAQGQLAARGDEPDGYRAALAIAVFEYKVIGNFAEAHRHFREAHRLHPTAQTLHGMGMTELALQRHDQAILHLEQALEETHRPLGDEERKTAVELLARARTQMPRLFLNIQPEEASVVIDDAGTPIYAPRMLALAPGKHVLEFRARGRLPEKRVIELRSGEEKKLDIALHKEREPEPPRRWNKDPFFWSMVGLLVVSLTVGTAVGIAQRDAPTEVGPMVFINTMPAQR